MMKLVNMVWRILPLGKRQDTARVAATNTQWDGKTQIEVNGQLVATNKARTETPRKQAGTRWVPAKRQISSAEYLELKARLRNWRRRYKALARKKARAQWVRKNRPTAGNSNQAA